MKKNIIISVLSTIVVVFIILMIVGLTTKEEVAQPDFKETIKENFMNACVPEGEGLYSFCNCSFEALYEELGSDGLVELENELIRTNELPEGTLEIVAECF